MILTRILPRHFDQTARYVFHLLKGPSERSGQDNLNSDSESESKASSSECSRIRQCHSPNKETKNKEPPEKGMTVTV